MNSPSEPMDPKSVPVTRKSSIYTSDLCNSESKQNTNNTYPFPFFYSFVYVFEDGQWKISHHHSSAMPEAGKKEETAPKITEKEVSKLFNLWNDALATGDPSKVADRYSKNAVLLPTVSDKPRTDYNGIRDYFVDFLKKKPQGVIVAENIMIGDGWAKDGGVYQFTMGADGSVVNARYSFLYVYEDGEWKIAHHHSSAMPEGLLEAAAKVEQLEAQLA